MKYGLILLLLCGPVADAQMLPQHVEFQELGLSFDLPSGWQGQLMEDVVVLGHNHIAGMMLLSENLHTDIHALHQQAIQGIYEEGIQLQPAGDFVMQGDRRVHGRYRGYFNGESVTCYAVGLINGLGSGINILIIAADQQFSQQHIQAANALADSVRFFQSKDLPGTTQWKQKLSGMQLKYLSNAGGSDAFGGYSGSSRQTVIDLCHNGQFAYESEYNLHIAPADPSGSIGATAYDNSQQTGQGHWQIHTVGQQSSLLLRFDDQREIEYPLAHATEPGEVTMNGHRFFYYTSPKCR